MGVRVSWSTLVRAVAMMAALVVGSTAHAAGPPDPQSWAGQLDGLSQWLDAHRDKEACTAHCYVLDRLTLAGSLERGALTFELTGALLAKEGTSVMVPLFGPPSEVRIENVTLDGKPAPIGFEEEHYFLHTSARRFTLRGQLAIGHNRSLAVPGPINTLIAELKDGHIVEGARLSGVQGATLHFDDTSSGAGQAAPTVFQLARAVRVQREITFEYRLTLKSGSSDLGVVRLPLAHGERVLEVEGSAGWRVEGQDVLLPTAGNTAEIKVQGTLPKAERITPDPRSSYEWLLIESDPEHRVLSSGSALPADPTESPIASTQPSARLYLMKAGQQVDMTVQTLTGTDVLAAVVRQHTRTLVVTKKGDLVADDTLSYENNGIDYLPIDLGGRPIYLAIDGKAETILKDDAAAREVLVPLSKGGHTVRAQSLMQTVLGTYGGKLRLPMPAYALTASTSTVTLGLPHHVHPIAFLGGDRPDWFFGVGDLTALGLSIALAWLTMRTWRLRGLCAIALAGLWFVSPVLFALLLATWAFTAAVLVVRRFRPSAWLYVGLAGLGMAGLFGVAIVGVSSRAEPAMSVAHSDGYSDKLALNGDKQMNDVRERTAGVATATITQEQKAAGLANGWSVLRGVTPVALALPGFARSTFATRELVTRERPFSPVLYYVTDYGLAPLFLLWLASSAVVLFAHRDRFRTLRAFLREKLERARAAAPVTAVPDAP